MIDPEDLVTQARVKVDELHSRKTALQQLADLLGDDAGEDASRNIYFALQEREKEGSTALGEIPVAIPHCRSKTCQKPAIAVLKGQNGESVEFGEDNVQLLVGMCFPDDDPDKALSVLQLVVKVLENPERLANLLKADTSEGLYEGFLVGLQLGVAN